MTLLDRIFQLTIDGYSVLFEPRNADQPEDLIVTVSKNNKTASQILPCYMLHRTDRVYVIMTAIDFCKWKVDDDEA